MAAILLQENGDDLWQENGDHILLDVWFHVDRFGALEVRDTSGHLVAILDNAYKINYLQQINTPHYLKFSLPATDLKNKYITLSNEIWLIDLKTREVLRKFRLQNKRDIR